MLSYQEYVKQEKSRMKRLINWLFISFNILQIIAGIIMNEQRKSIDIEWYPDNSKPAKYAEVINE